MYRITFVIILLFSATAIDAASYKKNDGTIVDPIQLVTGGDLPYSGNNLEPSASLSNANLSGAFLSNANLGAADLTNANLGAADLTDADLSGAGLVGADLSEADLTGAVLLGAYLFDANLTNANLLEADLSNASLYNADLTDADLSGANLSDADLRNANFLEASLNGADLTGARMWWADLSGADLSGSILTGTQNYNDAAWTDAFYYTDNEPTWDSGMDAAWRSSAGILALAPTSSVPEPSTLLLALLGLALVPRRRRR